MVLYVLLLRFFGEVVLHELVKQDLAVDLEFRNWNLDPIGDLIEILKSLQKILNPFTTHDGFHHRVSDFALTFRIHAKVLSMNDLGETFRRGHQSFNSDNTTSIAHMKLKVKLKALIL